MGRGGADESTSGSAEEFIDFGDVARGQLGMQSQYACHYVGGHVGSPDLSPGLRFKGDWGDYHMMEIHAEDAAEFVRRVKLYQRLRRNGEFAEADAFVASLAG